MDNNIYLLPNVTESQPTSSSLSLPSILVVLGLILSFINLTYWCIQDYRLYKSLGPGGPPYNAYGWFLTSFIVRPFTLAAKDTLWTGDYPNDGAHKEILALPNRRDTRPVILGIAPQRQFSQNPEPGMNVRVTSLFTSVVMRNPRLLQQKLSSLEKHNIAIFVHSNLLSKPDNLPEVAVVSEGELGHIHGDASMHLYFSPADAKVIIEKGWAERHRCARTQPWWLGGNKYKWKIGESFLIVYAPRDEEELEVLQILIRASARFMTGDETVVAPSKEDQGMEHDGGRRKSAPPSA
ncbi:hypothetical protein H2202_008218 [Exophiala xenobiotica]|nr:hypothetical protein H2202_008218 [Exophiala xenobiotica]KAK5206671.1 hypothetical protein LTR41_007664 [Exophiala xenobiotica]KAK5227328.1 hypothetical protein LTR72_003318 [Exophiala xenobiotica]KAK5232222.1 hypothetical protein LTR47_006751 [Exophiala xenobiotica]KAK5244135.1 hypothetical protein LTS06_010224 [Exophiala xenobiotica]